MGILGHVKHDQESVPEPWFNDWDRNGLWEYQVQPLTVGDLLAALDPSKLTCR